jgi:prevent-host-death family protein
MSYNWGVKVAISEFRKNLFQLVDKALNGDVVEITHKGNTIRLVPEAQVSKLDRLTPIHIFNPAFSEEDHQRTSRELFAEIQREWERDWSEL